MLIDREDMLELSRRMTSQRTHIMRVAGAYMDDEGYVDGTFNTYFGNVHGEDRNRCMRIAHAIPIAETNVELKAYKIPGMRPGSVWQLLYALRDCELKNDALLLSLYELFGEKYQSKVPYAIYLYYGVYDVPVKAKDKSVLDGSEEIYKYLLLSVSPLESSGNPGEPDCGFLFPAFSDHSMDLSHIDIYRKNGTEGAGLIRVLGGKA